jgi:hypothetical protein
MTPLLRFFRKRFASPWVRPQGNHEENLAAHPPVLRAPVGKAAMLDVPIWVDIAPDHPSQTTYDGLLWEIEPYGEYLYYLAGDFPRNDKGLLRYASATTRAEVHVSFETDAIDVAAQDQPRYAALAQAAACDDADLATLTVRHAQRVLNGGNGAALLRGAPGFSHVDGRAFYAPLDGVTPPSIVLTTCLIDRDGPRDRMTMITTVSSNPDQIVGPLADYHRGLTDRYHQIAHLPLSGAIRM